MAATAPRSNAKQTLDWSKHHKRRDRAIETDRRDGERVDYLKTLSGSSSLVKTLRRRGESEKGERERKRETRGLLYDGEAYLIRNY